MSDPGLSRDEFKTGMDSLRGEFQAGLNTAGVQIGAVEKTLVAKISGLRAWGVAALVGGQTIAGIIAVYGPKQSVTTALNFATKLFS